MKRNLKQYMGVCLLLILSMVSGHTALAANTWKMAAQELTANERTTLSIELANSDTVSAFQFTIKIPKGLLLMGNPVLNAARTDGHTLSWTPLQENQYLCVVYSLQNGILKGNTGELLSIPVLVDPSFTGGTVKMTNLLLTNKQAQNLAITAELGALSLKKEKQRIQLIVTGLTQTVSEKEAGISLTTIPADLTGFTITYSAGDRKQAGVFDVTVTRQEDNDYLAVNETFRMVIEDKREASITTPTASAINAGQRLSQSILSEGFATFEGSPVPGKFVWQNPEQEVTAVGSYTAVFVPTDNSRYANVEVSVLVTVNTLYNVYLLPQAGGSLKVEGEHADQTYVAGQTLKVTAESDPNYEFVRWNDNNTSPSRTITVSSNMTLIPVFERPSYTVTLPTSVNNGTLVVTCDGVILKPGINECLKGSTILAQATPNTGYTVQTLTIGGIPQTKYTVTDHVAVEAFFTKLKVDNYAIKTAISGEGAGTVRLFNESGQPLLPGASLAKGNKFIVVSVPEPGSELEVLEVSGATLADGIYTVTGETTISAKFEKRAYQLELDVRGKGRLTFSPQQTNYYYGDEVAITASEGDLYRLVVNGKALEAGDKYTITGPTTVYAKFIEREEIDPKYINTAVQSYVFDNHYHRFDVSASDIYGYWTFDVSYPDLTGDKTAPVNAGDHKVKVTRREDPTYKTFELEIPAGLKIEKAKMRVTEAPTSATADQTEKHGATLPEYDRVEIKDNVDGKDYLHSFTYYPNDNDAANYDPVIYYLSTSKTTHSLTVTGATSLKAALRDGGNEEGTGENSVNGYVLVTNGNMVVENLTEIPMGTKLTLQAIAKPGFTFKGWKIGGASEISETKNPIEDIPLESNLTYEPVFKDKATLTATLTQDEFDYIEGTPNVEITVKDGDKEVSGAQLRFFAEEACKTAIEPTNVKNVGTYYVQAYRAEDDLYQELKGIFSFKIKAVTPSTITWPDASNIVEGELLAASTLIGGNADSIPGSFAWKEGQTISGAGEKTPTVVFTPLDPNYTSCEGTVKLNVLSTTSSTTETKEPVKPSDPVSPDTPEEPEKPTVTPPVVTERTPTTAVITWDKVEGATAYKLFLYAKKGDTTPLMTYEFDANGQLKASAISFNLTGLEEGKSYYVKTVAYQGEEVLVEQAIALSATPTAIERIADAVEITTTKGMIHVTLATPLSVRVLSMSGLTLYEQTDAVGSVDIPVGNAGVYAVILYKGHEVLLRKVIVR